MSNHSNMVFVQNHSLRYPTCSHNHILTLVRNVSNVIIVSTFINVQTQKNLMQYLVIFLYTHNPALLTFVYKILFNQSSDCVVRQYIASSIGK